MSKMICPYFMGYPLLCPLRRLISNPHDILSSYIKPGMTVLDVGPAMGFFSIAMAELVGTVGKVICVDVREKMLIKLRRRAAQAGVSEQIETHTCRQESLGLADRAGKIDFALAFAVVHEMPQPLGFFSEINTLLKPGAMILVGEPCGHVSSRRFEKTIVDAETARLKIVGKPPIRLTWTVLLQKPLA